MTSTTQRPIAALPTPSLLLDPVRMERNIARLRKRLAGLGVAERPHLKTCKSVEVARLLMQSPAGPATVSTLAEAEAFANAGVRDMIYAVGIAPGKLDRVAALRARGVDLAVILDSVEQAQAVAAKSADIGSPIPALIEVDADGHRAGVPPGDRRLMEIGRVLHAGAELRGVLTHSGGSYNAASPGDVAVAAEQERAGAVAAAATLRSAGLPCPVVSVGSTPAALAARSLDGVTEVRAGVYVFFDLVMAGLGVCEVDDIAISVLATVIGHQKERGWILVDAGWMALSRDRGTSGQKFDQGYGLVCDVQGGPIADLIVVSANQEHGIVAVRPGSDAPLPDLPVGTLLRILPNHACATAGQHAAYEVLAADQHSVVATWPRIGGW